MIQKMFLMICMLLLIATLVSAGNTETDNQLTVFLDQQDAEQEQSNNMVVPIIGLSALAIIFFNRKKIFKG